MKRPICTYYYADIRATKLVRRIRSMDREKAAANALRYLRQQRWDALVAVIRDEEEGQDLTILTYHLGKNSVSAVFFTKYVEVEVSSVP